LYLTPSTNWNEGNARFAAYFFGNGEKWISMTKVTGETNLYEVEAPAGYIRNRNPIIFEVDEKRKITVTSQVDGLYGNIK
jgi:hypothetical protein